MRVTINGHVIHVKVETYGLTIAIDGYTTAHQDDGIIHLDCFGSEPRLVVWSDKENQDPTHVIEFKESKSDGQDKRSKEDSNPLL